MLQNTIMKAITGCIPVMSLPPPPHSACARAHPPTMQGKQLPDIQEHVQIPTWSQ